MLSKIRTSLRQAVTDEVEASPAPALDEEKKQNASVESGPTPVGNEPEGEATSKSMQYGVRTAEAVTNTWTKGALIAAFINMWFLYFVNAFQTQIVYTFIPYLTSEWESHSLLNVIYVVSGCMTASVYVPLAKVMDVWGRAEGFLAMSVLSTLGLVIMAACNNLPTFCAGYVFYSIGFSGIIFSVDVITSDSSTLRNRGLAFAFTSSPYMITAFAGPKAADEAYNNINYRWGIGAFAIIFPVVAAPLYINLKYHLRKAAKEGQITRERSGRTLMQNIVYWTMEFDIVGVFLFSAGLVVFLLPFSIATSAPQGWSTGYIIAMIVVGFVMLVFFILWETFVAPTPLLRFHFLANRTVLGACLLDATYQICYYCWSGYFTSFLQVVNNLDMATAGYVSNTFDVVSGVLLFIVGYLIHRTGRFRWLLFIAVPLYIFAQGLMIYFRRPNQSVGYLVMCEVFISIAGAIFIIIQQLAVLAAVDHQHVAAALALLNVVGTVGGALGSTISGAIWTNTFRPALAHYLPPRALPNLDNYYELIEAQLRHPPGSPIRLAVQEAYGYAQTRMLAVGTGIMGLSLIWMFLIRNIDLRKVQQVHGKVF